MDAKFLQREEIVGLNDKPDLYLRLKILSGQKNYDQYLKFRRCKPR